MRSPTPARGRVPRSRRCARSRSASPVARPRRERQASLDTSSLAADDGDFLPGRRRAPTADAAAARRADIFPSSSLSAAPTRARATRRASVGCGLRSPRLAGSRCATSTSSSPGLTDSADRVGVKHSRSSPFPKLSIEGEGSMPPSGRSQPSPASVHRGCGEHSTTWPSSPRLPPGARASAASGHRRASAALALDLGGSACRTRSGRPWPLGSESGSGSDSTRTSPSVPLLNRRRYAPIGVLAGAPITSGWTAPATTEERGAPHSISGAHSRRCRHLRASGRRHHTDWRLTQAAAETELLREAD